MGKSLHLRVCWSGVLAAMLCHAVAQAETVQLRRVQFKDEPMFPSVCEPGQLLLRLTSSQSLSVYGDKLEATVKDGPAFSSVIKKEPPAYACKRPFRGVVKLGSEYFGLVLDGDRVPSKGYNRLYLDRNHNGDLTDDEVIQARPATWSLFSSAGMREFPRISVTVRVDGKPVEYALFLMVYCYGASGANDSWSVSLQLMPAVYYEGNVTLDGKPHRIILQDFNSNGRFDESWTFDAKTGEPNAGDVFLLDPDLESFFMPGFGLTDRKERNPFSKLVNIDGRFYDLQLSPTCETLTLTPSKLAMASVSNPGERYEAVLFGEKGMFKIRGDKSNAVAVPIGDWKLSSYAIEASTAGLKPAAPADARKVNAPAEPVGTRPSQRQETQRPIQERVLAWLAEGGLARANPLRARVAVVSAQWTKDPPTVKVREGKTALLPFGPPYKAVVEVSYVMGDGQVSLGMKLVGSAGETCTNLLIEGGKPSPPTFEIRTTKGKLVESGKFEFG